MNGPLSDMALYRVELPVYGAAPTVFTVFARNARDARREASRVFDAYWNRGRMPGERQRTPASHWNVHRYLD